MHKPTPSPDGDPIDDSDHNASPRPRRRKQRGGIPGLLAALVGFLLDSRKFWLIPIILVLVMIALVIFLGSAVPALAPFLYSGLG